jgi:hypothetical protein
LRASLRRIEFRDAAGSSLDNSQKWIHEQQIVTLPDSRAFGSRLEEILSEDCGKTRSLTDWKAEGHCSRNLHLL